MIITIWHQKSMENLVTNILVGPMLYEFLQYNYS